MGRFSLKIKFMHVLINLTTWQEQISKKVYNRNRLKIEKYLTFERM